MGSLQELIHHLIKKITFITKWQVVSIYFFRIMHEQSFTAEFWSFFFSSIAIFLAYGVYLASNSASYSEIYAKPSVFVRCCSYFRILFNHTGIRRAKFIEPRNILIARKLDFIMFFSFYGMAILSN